MFYLPDKELSSSGDRFFIATHSEVEQMQLSVNKGNKTERGKGADNIPLKAMLQYPYEDQWEKAGKLLK